ncbi:M28 family metallopeptidase [Olivibacter sitiensis]|uniref:M28 family metallopeptidase n=1 Tax=Olivibacter sitiensis TaxID=376470 RepID=UPI000481DDDD|nr:M28 family metallopeptidase [Olivibacter sitiensis]
MKTSITLLVGITILCPTFSSAQAPYQQGLDAVNGHAIKGTMSFLADDLLEGRKPGTRGFALASKYVESQFVSLGLLPAGENNTYVQKVPLVKGSVIPKRSSLVFYDESTNEEWTYERDYLLNPYFFGAQSKVDAPIEFVGFGISAPELGYDDYQGLDVKGKVVLFIEQAPETFGNNERAYFTSAAVKHQEAEKRGAIGAMSIALASRYPWDATVARAATGQFRWVAADGNAGNSYASLRALATLQPDKAIAFFKGMDKDLEQLYQQLLSGKTQSFTVPYRAKVEVSTETEAVESQNLIGLIPGSDPILKDEYIVYAAHVDHFGIGRAVDGDSIYNGAHDNASGVAIVLQTAKAFQQLKIAPKRSIIFAVVTAEESGLLGSDYFANNPTVKGKMVANLALDMPFFFHPVLDIVPYGAQHSSLNKEVTQAASVLQLDISPDPFPQQVVFIRSDHFSFIKQGIPSLFIKSGFKTVASDTVDRSKSDVAWRTEVYHTPKDDMNQAFDFDGAATHAKLNFLIGYFIADTLEVPQWNKGDFFGDRFRK